MKSIAQTQKKTNHRKNIIKSGVGAVLILEMDDSTFQSHVRVNRRQFQSLLCLIGQLRNTEDIASRGREKIEPWKELLILLWYMANQNSFREIGDKFGITTSSAYRVVVRMISYFCKILPDVITRWTDEEKETNAVQCKIVTGLDGVIGAIDGCHIRISRPPKHGDDYMNRKGYYSVLLQGICDFDGKLRDVFVGAPGKVHDARLLRLSPISREVDTVFGNRWKLLGDSAYISHDFHFIRTPKQDNGLLTRRDLTANAALSRGRVIIENTFGRLKCRFRRIRDVQNILLPNVIGVILVACALHNITTGNVSMNCPEHPDGCPRDNDDNDGNDD